MGIPYTRAPHGGAGLGVAEAPHAALLIDFDNVTMGMRSDLSKELKTLLDSDIIKGKVSVQRAYADWRRYPQYIVPLSEASVDLIFAPAYGSNKKNATDIRMAIDAVELVFIRPEIGTFILLTGDSDFSSLVLKLKEYGKYVIGVGIQESTSDILVQNCDEYYSYTSLSGLKQTTESDHKGQDPWVLVKDALKKMMDRGDVMRSDRLKQVMQELDASFDEGSLGFSKFSKFLTEASSRGLVKLHKMDNGQYEVAPSRGRGRKDSGEGKPRQERSRSRGERRQQSARGERTPRPQEKEADPLQDAYGLLKAALEDLREAGRDPVRDSDLKRKMLELDRSFDEAELGFPKFTRFLGQAGDHDVVRLIRTEEGTTEVSLTLGGENGSPASPPSDAAEPARAEAAEDVPSGKAVAEDRPSGTTPIEDQQDAPAPTPPPPGDEPTPTVIELDPSELGHGGLRLGPRRGTTRRRESDGPALLAGQVVAPSTEAPQGSDGKRSTAEAPAARGSGSLDASALGLPTDPEAIVRYLAHRYRGVGQKTAESLVDRFGADLFRVLRDDPAAITATVTTKRAEQVLDAWSLDYERRRARVAGGEGESTSGRGASGEGGDRRKGRHRAPRDRHEG
ncbi:MAG: NYN domain-containing protein [Gemmatimonadota bacterium]